MSDEAKKKWFQQDWAIVLLLVVFFPVGLYLMWKHAKWSQKAKGIVTGVLALVVVASVALKPPEPTKTAESNKPKVQQEDKKTENKTENKKSEDQVFALNQPATDGDFIFTVTGVTKTKTLGNEFTQKSAQGEFAIVAIRIENKGKKTKTFDTSMAKVKDSNGREFERSVDGQTAKGLSQGQIDLFLQQIQPGSAVTGDIVFDLPADATVFNLVAKGSLIGKGVQIKLQ